MPPLTDDQTQSPLGMLMRYLERPVCDDFGVLSLSLVAQLQRALSWVLEQSGPESDALAEFLQVLLVRLSQDSLPLRIALQQAQFEAQLARDTNVPDTQGRLMGDAHAMGMVLANLLPSLSAAQRERVFSDADYRALNPDVAASGIDPFEHYLSSGAEEGRAPRALSKDFPGSYPDVLAQTLTALVNATAPPRFSSDLPTGIRDEALMLLGKTRPTVSVILPTWNRAHTVVTAVSSALLQSYAATEVIVIDDGSSDCTAEILRTRFPEPLADGRLVLIRQDQSGVSAARNTGLAQARGTFIAYLDSDNRWETDHLLFSLAGLLSTKRAQSTYTALCRHNLTAGWSDVLFHAYDPVALSNANFIDLNSFVHHRELYEKLGGFDESLTRLVDWDLILRYSAQSAPVALPVITGHHIIDSVSLNNITTSENSEANMARIRAKQNTSAS